MINKLINITKYISICSGPIIVVMGTFILDTMLKQIFNLPESNINKFLSTGIIIVLSMLILSIFFKLFHKKSFNENYNTSLVLINYLVGCMFAVMLSLIYIHDWSLALTWFVVLLGKFIWFDGISFTEMIDELKVQISPKKDLLRIFFVDIIIVILFLGILKIYEMTERDYIFFMYTGIFWGMGYTGISLYLKEKSN
jgi:hypothetical protein